MEAIVVVMKVVELPVVMKLNEAIQTKDECHSPDRDLGRFDTDRDVTSPRRHVGLQHFSYLSSFCGQLGQFSELFSALCGQHKSCATPTSFMSIFATRAGQVSQQPRCQRAKRAVKR